MNNAVDVIVVGGGIGGLANAYALSRQGLKVRLLERSREFGRSGPACRSPRTAPGSSTSGACWRR